MSGTFRADFDLRSFPFDKHRLTIGIEEGVEDASTFKYELDLSNSGLSPHLAIPEWKVSKFSAVERTITYPTTFGDPLLPASSKSSYTHIDFEIEVRRAELTSFYKIAVPAYVAALLALISLLMHVEEGGNLLNPRIGLLAGSLFAVVFNMRAVDDVVGATPATTLMDTIHFSALAVILGATMYSVFTGYLAESGTSVRRIRRLDYTAFIAGTAAFVLANVYIITAAMRS